MNTYFYIYLIFKYRFPDCFLTQGQSPVGQKEYLICVSDKNICILRKYSNLRFCLIICISTFWHQTRLAQNYLLHGLVQAFPFLIICEPYRGRNMSRIFNSEAAIKVSKINLQVQILTWHSMIDYCAVCN